MGRLGSGPHVVGRLGSTVFALTAAVRKYPRWEGKLSGGEMSRGGYVRHSKFSYL